MTTTVADIAAEAFDAVAAEITGVILACTLTQTTQGEYDTTTGAYATTTATYTGRAVSNTGSNTRDSAIGDIFGDYVAGPNENLFFVEGLSVAPLENDTLTIGGTVHTVTKVGDVAGAGTFFGIMAIAQ